MRCVICDHLHTRHNPVTVVFLQDGTKEDVCEKCFDSIWGELVSEPGGLSVVDALFPEADLETPPEVPILAQEGTMP